MGMGIERFTLVKACAGEGGRVSLQSGNQQTGGRTATQTPKQLCFWF